MTQTKEQTPAVDVTYTDYLHDRIRAARDAFVADRSRRSQPFTDAAQLDVLSLLAVGMPITEITAILGVAPSTIYHRRHADQEFARQWALAVEMRYTHLEDRLDHVAMNTPIESMAGVRAAEILLKASNPRYRPDPHAERPAPQPQRFPHGLDCAIAIQ